MVSALFVGHRFILEPDPGLRHANIIGATLLLLSCPFALRFSRSLPGAAHLLTAGMLCFVSIDCWLYGGLGSPPAPGLLVVPLLAVFFLGPRPGSAYAVATVGVLILLFVLELNGVVGTLPPSADVLRMRFAATVGVVGFIAVMAAFYEMERRAADSRARAIVDNLSDGVFAVDLGGHIAMANRSVTDLLGVAALPGTHVEDTLPEELVALIAASAQSGETQTTQLSLSSDRVAAAAASPIELEAGGRVGTVLIVRDVSVEASVDRMKTDFIATVSHEMRTPLTSVLGFAKLIRSRLTADVFPLVPESEKKARRTVKKVSTNLGIIIEEGERLTHLIGDVLDIAKLESGQMEWHKEDVDVAQLAERAIDATGGLFADGEVELRAELTPGLRPVHADPQRILQVLINLISNAAKFTDAGSVTVELSEADGHAVVAVVDTGCGIAPLDQEKIFDRFRQAGDSLLDKPRGTGLGLPICVEIVDAHGGSIRVTSVLGEGATFTVALPFHETA